MTTPPPMLPPKRKKDDLDYFILAASLFAIIGTITCLIVHWAVLIIVPAVATISVIIVRNARKKIEVMRAETDHLRPYQHIVDAEAEAGQILHNSKISQRLAESLLQETTLSTQKIRIEAEALKNRIEGYGDEYVIPTHDLIEELSENYGHTLAGQKLKEARTHTKAIIKKHLAVRCIQENPDIRKALERVFILAFNGDAEETLARAKHDNFGKLAQEMNDAHALINRNGEVFGTTITKDYLDARVDELRWVVITYELKKREADEQREIRERIREEERAQREFAKAIAEAEKEEKAIKVALEKARAEAAQASETERATFEEKLREMEARLAEAEAKGQRAISMAQQTKAGVVYIISNIGSFGENVFKIGMTRRDDPQDRVDELSDASVPFGFDVHAFIKTDDAPGLENQLHRQFDERRLNKVNWRKEFFALSAAEIRDALGDYIKDTTFTLQAEAKEYRESMALRNQKVRPDVLVTT